MPDLDRFFMLSPDLLVVGSVRDGLIKRANPAACRSLGWSETELVSRSCLDLIHPDDRDNMAAAVTAIAAGEPKGLSEYRVLRKDGSYFWTEWHSGYFAGEALLYGIGRDITERKQAEAALAAAEAERTAVLESITDSFFVLDADWRVTYVNARAAAVLKQTPETMVGRQASDIARESASPLGLFACFQQVMADRQQRDLDYFSEFTGQWASARIYPRDDGGLSIYRQDITERKRMEETLRASKAHFEAVANLVPDLLWRGDPDGTPTWSNEACSNYFGRPIEALPDGVWSKVHPDDVEKVRASFEAALRSKQLATVENRICSSDGVYRWFLLRVRPLLGSDGAVTAWFGAAADIDDLKRAQGQQELLIAELQHRTRNLLAVVHAIAAQTIAGSTSLNAFAEPFNSRLGALSRVQSFLSQGGGMGIRELLRAELAAHGIEPNEPRVIVHGPSVELPTGAVQPLALGVHELTTNALKHGAFATSSGRLAIRWSVDGGARPALTLEWRESGGAMPDQMKPVRRGFGLNLIERGLPYQLGATTKVIFSSDGVVCNLALPLPDAASVAPPPVAEVSRRG